MQLLYKSASFTNSRQDLKSIYLTYIRSAIEQSAVVWHSSLTKKNRKDLERVQKTAIKVILGSNYTSYKDGLKMLKIQSLDERRRTLCLKFAKNCLKNEKVKNMFPINKRNYRIETRKRNKFKIFKANTERYDKSAVPYMRKILNEDWQKNMKNMKT